MRRCAPRESDIVALCCLCRESLTWSPRWQGPEIFQRTWWRTALESDGGECWALEDSGRITGFCQLVTDEDAWQRERSERLSNRLAYVRMVLARPCLSLVTMRGYLRPIIRKETGSQRDVPEYRRRLWLELMAVAPECWGSGPADAIMSFAIERAQAHQRDAIALMVERHNKRARAFYARWRFVAANEGRRGIVMVRSV